MRNRVGLESDMAKHVVQEILRLANIGAEYERLQSERVEGLSNDGFNENVVVPKDLAHDESLKEKNYVMGGMPSEGMERKNGFLELFEKYPEVRRFQRFDRLPRGFALNLAEGMEPVEAWEAYMAEVERLENVFVQQMVNGRGKAAPSVKSNGEAHEDEFVKSLFGK